MNIEVFEHEVLGELHVFGDEKGLWFNYNDVVDCLDIEKNTAQFKYKFLPKDLGQNILIDLDGGSKVYHRFIHEKAVYDFMMIGTSECCLQFQAWVREIAYRFDILNIHVGDNHVYSDFMTDYNYMMNNIKVLKNEIHPSIATLKACANRVDEYLHELEINDKPVITNEKSYRTDYTVGNAWSDPEYEVCEDGNDYNYKFEQMVEELRDLENKNELEYVIFGCGNKESKEPKQVAYTKYRKIKGESTCPDWIRELV